MRHTGDVPASARAILDALQFEEYGTSREQLAAIDWNAALAFADRTHLALPLAIRSGEQVPQDVQRQLQQRLARNATRWLRVRSSYQEIASAFVEAGIEFIVLKGFSHAPLFVDHPRLRPQYDLDLLIPDADLARARDIANQLGYQALRNDRTAIDHLPAMIRKNGWRWQGDYFDPEIPLSLELHFQLWDASIEGFAPAGLGAFWRRRQLRQLDDLCFPSFHDIDAVGYASLHLLRHILRGNVLLYHAYELAWFLHRHSKSESFWREWRELHDDALCRLQAICFLIARRWFNCNIHPVVQKEVDQVPHEIQRWIRIHGESPLAGLFRPNKDELWLHWNLVRSNRTRMAILWRRLVPRSIPGPVDAIHLLPEQITWRIWLRSRFRHLAFIASRFRYHLQSIPGTASSAIRWFAGG